MSLHVVYYIQRRVAWPKTRYSRSLPQSQLLSRLAREPEAGASVINNSHLASWVSHIQM